jgi:hypothetical protein
MCWKGTNMQMQIQKQSLLISCLYCLDGNHSVEMHLRLLTQVFCMWPVGAFGSDSYCPVFNTLVFLLKHCPSCGIYFLILPCALIILWITVTKWCLTPISRCIASRLPTLCSQNIWKLQWMLVSPFCVLFVSISNFVGHKANLIRHYRVFMTRAQCCVTLWLLWLLMTPPLIALFR